jgi:hypothetical protein
MGSASWQRSGSLNGWQDFGHEDAAVTRNDRMRAHQLGSLLPPAGEPKLPARVCTPGVLWLPLVTCLISKGSGANDEDNIRFIDTYPHHHDNSGWGNCALLSPQSGFLTDDCIASPPPFYGQDYSGRTWAQSTTIWAGQQRIAWDN